MKKSLILIGLIFTTLACEKKSETVSREYTASIAGFDLNCSTCILEFPYNSTEVKGDIGGSAMNYYHAVNLSKGDFNTGQKIKVRIRKAGSDESAGCLALFPGFEYEKVFVESFENFENVVLEDTISLSYHDCVNDLQNKFSVCFDSLLSDSRCPEGAVCFWEGNAEAKFRFQRFGGDPVLFNLNTYHGFTNETVIDGYRIKLVGLTPQASLSARIKPKYIASISIKKL